MKISDILNENDLKLLDSHKSLLGNPDNDYLDEILLEHSLSLDTKDYALLRLSYTLRNIEETLCRIEDSMR
jgi:hypothetical protein